MHWLNCWEALGPIIRDLRRAASQNMLLSLEGDRGSALAIFVKQNLSHSLMGIPSAFVHVSKKR